MRGDATEIIPGLLWQRGRFYDWPGSDKRALLARHGIVLVVNLWGKADPELEGAIQLVWPGIKSDDFPVPLLHLLQTFVLPALQRGWPTLVHCEAGRGRSVAACAVLLAGYEGIDTATALQRLRTMLSGYDVNPKLESLVVNGS